MKSPAENPTGGRNADPTGVPFSFSVKVAHTFERVSSRLR